MKKQISPHLAPLEKFWKNHLVAPVGKNPSDAYVTTVISSDLLQICCHAIVTQ